MSPLSAAKGTGGRRGMARMASAFIDRVIKEVTDR